MRLGGSLRRTRKRGRTKKSGKGGATEGRPKLVLRVLVLALAGWAAGYLVATQILFPAPPPTGDLFVVPDLRGATLAEASASLESQGLVLGEVDSLQHPTAERGSLIGQVPLPGQLAMAEASVRVTVSAGPQRRAVPDVVRLEATRARIMLEASGFVVAVDSVESPFPKGHVVGVFPPPDSTVALPAEVRLSVSTGPPTVAMPLVLGMEEEEAVEELRSLGLVITEVREVFRFGRDQGIVVEQEPAADTELERGAGVRLSVGRRGGIP